MALMHVGEAAGTYHHGGKKKLKPKERIRTARVAQRKIAREWHAEKERRSDSLTLSSLHCGNHGCRIDFRRAQWLERGWARGPPIEELELRALTEPD